MGLFSKISQKIDSKLRRTLQKTSSVFSRVFSNNKSSGNLVQQIEDVLILADVGPELSSKLAAAVAIQNFSENAAVDIVIKKSLVAEITKVMLPYESDLFEESLQYEPCLILVVGVNGNGKTTTVAKIANVFKSLGKRPLLVAADTFRAAASEQLKYLADRMGVDVICGKEKSDPAGLIYDALEQNSKNRVDEQKGREFAEIHDVIIIDTAGRMQNRDDLMGELKKVKRVIKKVDPSAPHSTVLILDGITGQAAHSQVEVFQNEVGIDGVIVTKLDGSAKGGALISLAQKYGTKIFAVGVGEALEDLRPFKAREYAEALVGLSE